MSSGDRLLRNCSERKKMVGHVNSKTEKLYFDDAYATRFEGTVIDAVSAGEGSDVQLDRSGFYPESGGQLPDRGRIGAHEVLDVQERDDDIVVHRVRCRPSEISGQVACEIEWGVRFDHMQQHTGQHVLSRAFIATSSLPTVAFHMGEDTCTIDLDGRDFDEDAIVRAEELAARVIEENRPITTRTVPVAELDVLRLRGKVPAGVSEGRLVEIAEFDAVPCCGTHVRSTGELRAIKVIRFEKAKGYNRVHFKVGRRALDDYAEKHQLIGQLSARLTTGVTEIAARIDKLVEENRSRERTVRALQARVAEYEAEVLLQAAPANAFGVRFIVRVVTDADGELARVVASTLARSERVTAVIGAGDGTVVCASSSDVEWDMAAALLPVARELGGNGGGRGGFARFSFSDEGLMNKFLEKAHDHVTTAR